jgi:hypothetical protein
MKIQGGSDGSLDSGPSQGVGGKPPAPGLLEKIKSASKKHLQLKDDQITEKQPTFTSTLRNQSQLDKEEIIRQERVHELLQEEVKDDDSLLLANSSRFS